MDNIRLTQLSHGGGCGCKIAPAVLADMLKALPQTHCFPELLVGTETADDAAVYRLNDEQALVATTDFFMPIVDDPFDFGRIAATNAISDIYAMGGKPILALAIVGMPINTLPMEAIQQILAGGASICSRAGIPLAGGQPVTCPSPIPCICSMVIRSAVYSNSVFCRSVAIRSLNTNFLFSIPPITIFVFPISSASIIYEDLCYQ